MSPNSICNFSYVRFALLLVLTCLSGCNALFGVNGVFPDKQSDYLDAKESKPIELPGGLEAAQTGDQYPIPDLEFSSVLPDKFELPRVDSLGELDSRGSVRIQKLLDDRWILVNRSPTQTWPLVVEFLSDNQVGIATQAPEPGFIETEWLKDAASDSTIREKYRFLFNAGVQAETTEVLIKQYARDQQSRESSTDWKKSSSDEREENMAKLLAQFLASSPDTASHSLLAQGLKTANKASIEYDETGRPFIDLQLPYPRGWASLGLALKKSEFAVADLNRDSGLYYANFEPGKNKKKKRNWFSRTFFPRRNKLEDVRGEYQITIRPRSEGNSLQIEIAREGEKPLATNEQAFLLNRILLQLS